MAPILIAEVAATVIDDVIDLVLVPVPPCDRLAEAVSRVRALLHLVAIVWLASGARGFILSTYARNAQGCFRVTFFIDHSG